MINPNRETSEDVQRRLKEASYERMRVELKCSIELLMKDFDISWDKLGELLGIEVSPEFIRPRSEKARHKVVQGSLTLNELNALAHIFSCEPYIIFRPREPWVAS